MSFKQKSSPLKQGMSAAQIAYSNTPSVIRPAALPANQVSGYYNSPEPIGNATRDLSNLNWNTSSAASTVSPTLSASSILPPVRGRNWFGNTTVTNTINGGPQSTEQGNTSGWRRTDSHNANVFDRTNGGQMFSNPVEPVMTDRSNMFSPFPQLKKEQMEYNNISPKAFSNAGTIEKMMGKSIPNSPFMQMIDPLTGVAIDPTMSQDPNTAIPPPVGVQTPVTPIYGINQ